ncbi:MAG TPA: hypothetical protein VLJ39_12900 [Tepidisphaeraceae bacterium]|nr:hypothetical protein [Tepidisphaeraceae bacterium]
MISRRQMFSAGAALAVAMLFGTAGTARAELQNPRLQKALQMLELTRGQLDAAIRQDPPDIRDGARETATEVDAAAHEIVEVMSAMGTRRQVEPIRAEPTAHPMRAARESLNQGMGEFTRGLTPEDFHNRPRLQAALDHMHAAMDRADRWSHREDEVIRHERR